jgi:hypothetical protein
VTHVWHVLQKESPRDSITPTSCVGMCCNITTHNTQGVAQMQSHMRCEMRAHGA